MGRKRRPCTQKFKTELCKFPILSYPITTQTLKNIHVLSIFPVVPASVIPRCLVTRVLSKVASPTTLRIKTTTIQLILKVYNEMLHTGNKAFSHTFSQLQISLLYFKCKQIQTPKRLQKPRTTFRMTSHLKHAIEY